MTRLVPRPDWTPEEFALAVRVIQFNPHLSQQQVVSIPAVLALFRPAEEPDPLGFRPERLAQGEADVAAGRVVELGDALQRIRDNPPSAGDRPGNPMPAPAPAAPPPTGEPAWMTSELRKNLDCMVFVDAQVFSQARGNMSQVFSQARASMLAAIDHAVLSALAALRAENERLRRELEAKA